MAVSDTIEINGWAEEVFSMIFERVRKARRSN